MKRSFNKIALTAALLLTLGATTTFAANTTDNGGANASFRKDFKQAELLTTDAGKDYTKITFKMNGVILFAFYNEQGELLAVTHNIKANELPINLLMPIKLNYSDYWITDCFEIDTNGTNSYYITLQNTDTQVILHSNGNDWDTYSKINKD
jgi:hypothetical protein